MSKAETREKQNFSLNKDKQIIYVWNYLEWGGAQTYFLGLIRVVKEIYQVKVILPAKSDKKILRYLAADNLEYDFYEGNLFPTEAATFRQKIRRRVNDLSANYKLAKRLSAEDLQNSAIQIDAAPWAAFFLLVFLLAKTDVFVTLHTAIPAISSLRRKTWSWKLSVLSLFRNFHLNASNEDVKKSLSPLVSAAQYEKITVIYSSFSAEQFEKALENPPHKHSIAVKYQFPADKTWVCCVGQFIERKGCWIYLEAIKILQNRRSDVFFFWLGTKPLTIQIEERIAEYGLNQEFKFLSAEDIGAARADLLTLWNTADIFALPSSQEGLPMALIEAMALGKACIASDINAVPEVIEEGKNGLLIKSGSAKELAEAVEKLVNDPKQRAALGENAMNTVFKNFEERVIGRKMLELYKTAFSE